MSLYLDIADYLFTFGIDSDNLIVNGVNYSTVELAAYRNGETYSSI